MLSNLRHGNNEAEVTPFVISDDAKVGDVTKLKYRYLDLRRPSLQNILITRSKITKIAFFKNITWCAVIK